MASYLYYVLPVLGGYTITSLYLLKNPHILHKKKRPAFRCIHISHRGGAGERIESTMEAFTHAVSAGTDMLELDCHLTRDGHVIVSHDENLLRQTGHDVTISSLNLEDMPLYKEKLEVTFYAGRYGTGEDRRFALLEDVFKKFPKMPVNIEIKEDNPLLMKKVASLVKQYDREDITVWASVESHIMKKCRKEFERNCILGGLIVHWMVLMYVLCIREQNCVEVYVNPSMPYMFTVSRGLLLLLLYYSGLLPFVPLGESFLQFYLPQIFNRTYIPDSPILKNRMIIFLIEKLTMRKSLFKHLAERGIQVHLFVCNEERDIEAAFAVGATGVMTDYPTLLSDYLRNHPHTDPHSQ